MSISFHIRNLGYTSKELTEFLKESNAIESVYGDEAMDLAHLAWVYLYEENDARYMSLDTIRETHRTLMSDSGSWSDPSLCPRWAGEFRTAPVYIGGKAAMNADVMIRALNNWCDAMNEAQDLQPEALEELSKELHVEYEKIHPFFDGNGRTGRMFMNFWRLKQGLPLLIIHEGYEQFEYYKWFNK